MTTIHLLTITPPNTLFSYKKKKKNQWRTGGNEVLGSLGRMKKGTRME